MKITEDVRKFAAEQGVSEQEALQKCMADKSREFTAMRETNSRALRIVPGIDTLMFVVEGWAGLLAH